MFYWFINLKMNVDYKITLIHGQPILDCMVPYLYAQTVICFSECSKIKLRNSGDDFHSEKNAYALKTPLILSVQLYASAPSIILRDNQKVCVHGMSVPLVMRDRQHDVDPILQRICNL